MIKSFFVCDNCKSEHELDRDKSSLIDNEQIVGIELRVNFGNDEGKNGSISKNAAWCRTCVMRYGLHIPYNSDDKKVAPAEQPKFEDLFIDLLERLGFERT